MSANRHVRWCCVSVRAFLVASSLAGILLAHTVRRARSHQRIIDAVRHTSDEIVFDYELKSPENVGDVDFSPEGSPAAPLWQRYVFGRDYGSNPVIVRILYREVSDETIDLLVKLKKLKVLCVNADYVGPQRRARIKALLPDCVLAY